MTVQVGLNHMLWWKCPFCGTRWEQHFDPTASVGFTSYVETKRLLEKTCTEHVLTKHAAVRI